MKLLHFLYHMGITFDSAVKDHHFTLKCLPKDTGQQRIESLAYKVYPNRFISRSVDSFGNESIYGVCEDVHNCFTVEVEGIVQTGFSSRKIAATDKIYEDNREIYKYQTPHTTPGTALSEYHDSLAVETELMDKTDTEKEAFSRAAFYMHRLWKDYVYVSGTTEITTTAEEAFAIGHGVCQDYAHILLSLCRMDHIPCRYVVGMLLGEGLSHAWVDIWSGGTWWALDPTHDREVGEDYIRISVGRDYKDSLLNQGVFTGIAGKVKQSQDIHITVEEMENGNL